MAPKAQVRRTQPPVALGYVTSAPVHQAPNPFTRRMGWPAAWAASAHSTKWRLHRQQTTGSCTAHQAHQPGPQRPMRPALGWAFNSQQCTQLGQDPPYPLGPPPNHQEKMKPMKLSRLHQGWQVHLHCCASAADRPSTPCTLLHADRLRLCPSQDCHTPAACSRLSPLPRHTLCKPTCTRIGLRQGSASMGPLLSNYRGPTPSGASA